MFARQHLVILTNISAVNIIATDTTRELVMNAVCSTASSNTTNTTNSATLVLANIKSNDRVKRFRVKQMDNVLAKRIAAKLQKEAKKNEVAAVKTKRKNEQCDADAANDLAKKQKKRLPTLLI